MSWSLKLGRVFGIPIFIHWTFLILIGYLLYWHLGRGDDLATTIEGVGYVLAIFGCIVLHELGHALAARHYGIPTTDITLLPIGGVARLQRMPERPSEELVVALAGPAVNVLLAGGLYVIGVRPPADMDPATVLVSGPFLPRLMFVNIFILLFNLLPAFPMDGGRVLRALLAMVMPYAVATRSAASIGQLMAIIFGFLGLAGGNPFLLLIALFVWIGAEAEARQVEERLILKDLPVREAMLTDFQTLSPDDRLGHASDLLLAGSQQDFPVLIDGRPQGVLTRSALFAGLTSAGRDGLVGQATLGELKSINADDPLVQAVAMIREGGEACLLVLEDGAPVGLLNLENIGEYLMIRTALAGADKGVEVPSGA